MRGFVRPGLLALALWWGSACGSSRDAREEGPARTERAAMLEAQQRSGGASYDLVRADGWLATGSNVAHRLALRFAAGRVEVELEGSTFWVALELIGIGRAADRQVSPPVDHCSVHGATVRCTRGELVEWYLNGPLGLEQGFELEEPPRGQGTLELTMVVSGTLQPALHGNTVALRDEAGLARARYGELYVADADGNPLPSRLAVDGHHVVLQIDDTHARYPLFVDPFIWAEQQKLTATAGSFGRAVSIDGDTLVVGAREDGTPTNSGAAYVFVRNGTVWSQQAKLKPSDTASGDFFGTSVSISGDTVVIGAEGDGDGGFNSGSAYVFVRNGTVWSQQAKFIASDPGIADFFGSTSSIHLDTAVIGAYANDDAGSSSGSAYVFVRNGTVWSQQQKLTASDAAAGAAFGEAVSVSGDTVVVGSGGPPTNTGAAYVFFRNGSIWSEQQKLTAVDGASGDRFGSAVSASGDTALVGARFDDDNGTSSGSSYVFVRSGTTWSQQQKLTAPDATEFFLFGWAVSVDGDTAVIGGWGDTHAGANSGSAHLFARTGTTWSHQQKLTASDAGASHAFGEAVSIRDSTATVGAANNFAVYVFQHEGAAGVPCIGNAECQSGFCVDGVCCDTACGAGDPSDCLVCSLAAGAIANGACSPSTGNVCRPSVDVCDAIETCDGVSLTCPPDAMQPATTLCRAAVDLCDAPESCNGLTPACPADGVAAVTAVCRAAAGPCDQVETCDGLTIVCPADAKASPTLVCRPQAGGCDIAESCDGINNACPTDQVAPSTTICRLAAGVCDASESCNGFGPACPTDAKQPVTTPCRAAADVCDAVEHCDGINDACPTDEAMPPTTVCRPASGACDAQESCNGTSIACPADQKKPSSTVCRPAADECDVADTCGSSANQCPPDAKKAEGAACGNDSDTICSAPDSCDALGNCLTNHAPSGTPCGPEDCQRPIACNEGGVCVGWCPDETYCAGVDCVPKKPNGEGCSQDQECISNACSDGICCNTPCTKGGCGRCDLAGSLGTCVLTPAGQVCRAAIDASCDVDEVCDGVSSICPDDAVADNGALCSGGSCKDGFCVEEVTSDGGCGCTLPGRQTTPWWGALLALLPFVLRRRQSQRRVTWIVESGPSS